MRKLLFIILACTVLLCGCVSKTYNYIGELPDGITPKTTMSEVIEKFGESQYSCEEIGDFATYNTLVYDYETQYDKCLLEFIFDKETDKLIYVRYVYYGDQKKMIRFLKLIYDDMKEKYGIENIKIPSDLDESFNIYKEEHDYDFVHVGFHWSDDNFSDNMLVGYTHQYNHDRLFIKELPACETEVNVTVFLNL